MPGTRACPYCAALLASDRALQCFACGYDWHDPQRVVRRVACRPPSGSSRRRRPRLGSLLAAWAGAQFLLGAAIWGVFHLPLRFVPAAVAGLPILVYVVRARDEELLDTQARRVRHAQRVLLVVFTLATLAWPARLPWIAASAFTVAVGILAAESLRAGYDGRRAPIPLPLLLYSVLCFVLLWAGAPQLAVFTVVVTFACAEAIDGLLAVRRWGRRGVDTNSTAPV
jgi:hypothetical protein